MQEAKGEGGREGQSWSVRERQNTAGVYDAGFQFGIVRVTEPDTLGASSKERITTVNINHNTQREREREDDEQMSFPKLPVPRNPSSPRVPTLHLLITRRDHECGLVLWGNEPASPGSLKNEGVNYASTCGQFFSIPV